MIFVKAFLIFFPEPGIPGPLYDDTYTAPNVTLTWQPSEGHVDFYLVYISETGANDSNSSNTSITLTGFKEGRDYHVHISAVSHGIRSEVREKVIRTESGGLF